MTQDELKALFFYAPETGIFKRLEKAGRPTKTGAVGSPDKDGYLRVKIQEKTHSLHRLAFLYMTGEQPKNSIDHINGKRDDNKFANLREATPRQNSQNRQAQVKNKNLPLGVFAEPGGFRARIRVNGKRVHLGTFKTPDDAAKAYQEAKNKHHIF